MGELIKSKEDRVQTGWRCLLCIEIIARKCRRPELSPRCGEETSLFRELQSVN